MVIRAVILDWSGTLVDDLPPVLKTTNHVLTTFGSAPLTLDQFRREFCLPIRKYYEQRLPGVPQARLEEVFLAEYVNHRHEIALLPQTMGFLEFCVQRRMGVFIASTVDRRTYEEQSARFDILKYVTRAYIGIADKTVAIHDILEENRLDRDQTMFVGDMAHDIEAGKAGGIHTCAVLSGYNHVEELRAAGPDLVCEHVGELQQVLAGLEVAHV